MKKWQKGSWVLNQLDPWFFPIWKFFRKYFKKSLHNSKNRFMFAAQSQLPAEFPKAYYKLFWNYYFIQDVISFTHILITVITSKVSFEFLKLTIICIDIWNIIFWLSLYLTRQILLYFFIDLISYASAFVICPINSKKNLLTVNTKT